jgi:hypothetical protein
MGEAEPRGKWIARMTVVNNILREVSFGRKVFKYFRLLAIGPVSLRRALLPPPFYLPIIYPSVQIQTPLASRAKSSSASSNLAGGPPTKAIHVS